MQSMDCSLSCYDIRSDQHGRGETGGRGIRIFTGKEDDVSRSVTIQGSDAPVAAGEERALERGALGLLDGTVIGVASAAPAYSLTATIAVLAGAIGLFSPTAMILAFIPMFCVAVGFYWLNRRMPNCGTSYAWIARALSPFLGFVTGWVIIIADVVVLVSLAGVAAASTLTLFGLDPNNKTSDLLVGVAWIALMSYIVIRGIRLAARVQWILLGLEYLIVLGFSVWAIVNVYANHPKGSHTFSLNWLFPFNAPGGWSAVTVAVLGAVFLYWGWDTAVNVNEETHDADSVPGMAALTSTVALLVIYTFAATAVMMYVPGKAISNNSSDVLTYMAQSMAGGNKIWYLMVLAVVSSTASCTQTSILPASRVAFSMARDGIIPAAFGWVHRSWRTPWFGSLAIGVVGGVLYVISLYASGGVGDAIGNAILALGLQVSFYYGLTGIAAAWYFRRLVFASISNLIFAGLFPLFGGLAFFYIFYKAAQSLTVQQFWTGVGTMLIGVPLLAWSYFHNRPFYHQPAEAAEPDEVAAQPATSGA